MTGASSLTHNLQCAKMISEYQHLFSVTKNTELSIDEYREQFEKARQLRKSQ